MKSKRFQGRTRLGAWPSRMQTFRPPDIASSKLNASAPPCGLPYRSLLTPIVNKAVARRFTTFKPILAILDYEFVYYARDFVIRDKQM